MKQMMMLKILNKSFLASLAGASTLLLTSVGQAQEQHDYAALAEAEQFEFLDQYCTQCHNFEDYSGGLDYSLSTVYDIPKEPAVWETTIRKLSSRMMPPAGHDKPAEARTDNFVAWLESYLDEAAAKTHELPHRKPIHRLNRKEYANAIRDLLNIDFDPTELLPRDNTSAGFDNIAEALQLSPIVIEQYVSAARMLVEQAVGNKSPSLGSTVYEPEVALPIRALGGGPQQQHIPGLPIGTRGGVLIDHWFPADGEYVLNVEDFDLSLWLYNVEFENHMIVTVDGEKVYETVIGGPKDLAALDKDQAAPMEEINQRTKNIRFTTQAGPRRVGVTFVRRSFAESDDRLEHFIPGAIQERIISIPAVEIRGPYSPTGITSTPSREQLFICYPEDASQEQACAERIIGEFASRAFRRPLNQSELAPLLDFYATGHQNGGFEEGIRLALTRTLSSPFFLFRAEVTPPDMAPGTIYQISDLELATRLSFFLWSSIPDEELLQVARAGELSDPAVLDAQVERMLADPKSRSLAANFAYQWLALDKLDELEPDLNIFPYASGAGDLRGDFKTEIELFIDSIVREDRSVLDMLDAEYSYLNERLALHYDIHNVKGNDFRRVELEDSRRWGLLGKGGILMATSYPNRTSPVLRGAYVLEHLMGTPAAEPPPNVEDLPEDAEGAPATTVRARLERHRDNPSCSSCHAVMDPLGFALDNFDAVGRWRDRDRYTQTAVDASGLLPNGNPVNGPADLREALLSRGHMFALALSENLMTYALGRAVEAEDMPAVRGIVRAAEEEDYRFSAVVKAIVNTPAFQYRKVPEPYNTGIAGSAVTIND